MATDTQGRIADYLAETHALIGRLRELDAEIERTAEVWIAALRAGRKIMFCGNGGSAADAQHLSAELVGRFLYDRDPLAAVALTVDTSALTAIGNDYGYEAVFSRQVKGIGQAGDVLVGLSTSGNSANVLRAFEAARSMGIVTIGLTGEGGGKLAALSDVLIAVPHRLANHIQEAHITVGHLICGLAESALCPPRG